MYVRLSNSTCVGVWSNKGALAWDTDTLCRVGTGFITPVWPTSISPTPAAAVANFTIEDTFELLPPARALNGRNSLSTFFTIVRRRFLSLLRRKIAEAGDATLARYWRRAARVAAEALIDDEQTKASARHGFAAW